MIPPRPRGSKWWLGVALASIALLPAPPSARARHAIDVPPPPYDDKDSHGVLVLDGSFVHNVGELQINITNWGLIGSWPQSGGEMGDAPSAMWPAGSGVDHLWAAGLWVGAIKNGVPLVTTGQPAWELWPNPDDPLDTIYESYQGIEGGARYPDPEEDDDGDGLLDEDPMNGVDDDDDGLIDEDFEAFGNQHFRCVMRDNTAIAQEYFRNHEPLDIEVIQESFQWENDDNDDFVGFRFRIRNIGVTPLQDVYLGFFADPDIGPRGTATSGDDLPHFVERSVRALDNSLVPLSVGVTYDDDGDNGASPGFFGMLFLDHPIDPSGETAPEKIGITIFESFSSLATFDNGGDPKTDEERYELLSRGEIAETPELFAEGKANDVRIVMGSGPFQTVDPDEVLVMQAAFVVGEGERGMLRNAAEAALTFYGAYFDRDNDRRTGVNGWETRICEDDFGPRTPANPIFRIFQDCVDSLDLVSDNAPAPINVDDLDDDACIWIDTDCEFEETRGNEICNQEVEWALEADDLAGCTGVEGKEYHVPWLVGLAPPAPHMRLWQTNNRIHVFWNNISELVPDLRLQEVDFESYRLWRADGWDRPFGSSIEHGPESRLWNLVAQYDKVNFYEDTRIVRQQEVTQILPLGPNTGFGTIEYSPRLLDPRGPDAAGVAEGQNLVRRILAHPEFSFLGPMSDPVDHLRFFTLSGAVSPVGLEFPELRDWEGRYADLDSIYWNETGVKFYEYVDRSVHNGIHYFYAVTAADHASRFLPSGELLPTGLGMSGDPQSNFAFAMPSSDAQTLQERNRYGEDIYVVPNPATRESLAEFSQLHPNAGDPTGVRVMFCNLPRAHNKIKIFTLAGDLVREIRHDGTGGSGSAYWNMISRKGQRVVSGIYLYSVETADARFERVIGRFVIIR